MTLELRVLGQLEAKLNGTPLDLGAFRQRAVLAFLLMHPERVVSTDTLIDELWQRDGLADHQNSLWVYVSNLRSALDPERRKRTDGQVLLTRSPGYLVTLQEARLDSAQFESLLGQVRSTIDADPAEAALMAREALGLWRGHAYEEFSYEQWAMGEIDRLEELRLEATELRIEADLRLGAASQVVSELEALHREHPLRERFVEQLMLALHRSGRSADALRAFSLHATHLGRELGIGPARSVRLLEERILADDPELSVASPRAFQGLAPGLAIRGYELREEIGAGAYGVAYRAFHPAVGREVAVKVIRPELADDPAFIRRFESEARFIAQLEHPHVVPLYDYWREPGAAYLVMRLVAGSTLEQLLEDRALTFEQTALMVDQLSRALSAAHQMGVYHQDIKPGNILLDDDLNAYLSDFGVAIAHAGGPEITPPAAGTVSPPYASPEQLAGESIDHRTDVFSFAVVIAQAVTGIVADYQQIRGGLDSSLVQILDRATAPSVADRFPTVRAFGLEVIDALGHGSVSADVEAELVIDNPYKGLRSFTSADTNEFFGRDRTIARLLTRLSSPDRSGRFIAVVGPSGSGKSSIVKAGLIPALRSDALPLSSSWFIAEMTPGSHPFDALEAALLKVAVSRPPSLVEAVSQDGLSAAVDRILPENSQLLLVIDQFEELYTLADKVGSERFIQEINNATESERSRIRFVITLRSDFYDRPVRHRELGELLRTGTELVTQMSRDELRSAIVGPAERYGVAIDPEVIHTMIDETLDQPGGLPLLQYTLTEAFDHRRGSRIGLRQYEEIGGVSGSLIRRADSILASLAPDELETARQVLLRLVTIGEDGASDTRRRALVADIRSIGAGDTAAETVLDSFGRRRLLSFDRDPVSRGPTAEVAHEALLTEWTTLRDWIDDARRELAIQQAVSVAIREWEESGRDTGYLLRGARLDRAESWMSETSLAVSRAERDYIDFSAFERANERAATAAREQEAQQAKAEVSQRTRQLSVVALVAVLVAALAGFSLIQRQRAIAAQQQFSAIAQSLNLASASATVLNTDPELAALLAAEGIKSTAPFGFATPDAVDAAHWALQELGVTYPVDESTPAYVRPGPSGATGVWGLAVSDLAAFAAESVSPRVLTSAECERYAEGAACPLGSPVGDVELLGGITAYASTASFSDVEVVIDSPVQGRESEELTANLAPTIDEWGFTIAHRQSPGGVIDHLTQGSPASIFLVPQPGALPAIAELHQLLDLSTFLDETQLESDFGTYLTSLTRLGPNSEWPSASGPIVGIFNKADVKSLIWTNPDRFARTGQASPETWQEFSDVVLNVATDGVSAPLCFGLDSDSFDGWAGTDLVENWVLRSQGPAFYDDWVSHAVPFDHPGVVEAISEIGRVFVRDGAVQGGSADATVRWFGRPAIDLWSDEDGSCSLAPGGSFFPILFESWGPAGVEPQTGVFEFPVITPGYADAILGGATMAIAVEDRPEIRAIMSAIASPEWGIAAMQSDSPGMLPFNSRFDPSHIAKDTFRTIHSSLVDAVTADSFRFDGSDQMPGEIGGHRGAFLKGMLRLFREGTTDNINVLSEEIAAEIESVWRELEDESS